MSTTELTEVQHIDKMIDRALGTKPWGTSAFPAEQPASSTGPSLAKDAQNVRNHVERLIDAAHPYPPKRHLTALRNMNQIGVQQYNPLAVEEEVERVARLPREVTGMQQDGNYAVPGEAEIIARIQHVLRPGEKVMEFFARTGLSRHQIFTLSPEEITAFVAVTADHEVVVP